MSLNHLEPRSRNDPPAAGTKSSRSCGTGRCEPPCRLIDRPMPDGSEPFGD